ncbi:hypothetical protein BKI52_08985 [marine bacterium AO1-C]|nr:hypothetical protein BKI52_08985 [marine bacterium AO1-C]
MKSFQDLKHYFPFLIFFTCFWAGCTEPVNVPGLDAQANQLVVDALFTTENRVHIIYLSRSTAITNANFPEETRATVYIIDDQNNRIDFIEQNPGSYFSPTVAAQQGRTYTLHIITNDGKRYVTPPQVLPNAPAPIKSLVAVDGSGVDDDGNAVDFAQVEVTFEDPADEENFYYWYWQSNTTEQFGIPDLTWGSAAENDELFNGNELVFTLDEEFNRSLDQYVKVYQAEVSQDTYTFLDNLKRQANSGQVPILPPGQPLVGNLTNQDNPNELVLGYFVLANVTSATVKLTP